MDERNTRNPPGPTWGDRASLLFVAFVVAVALGWAVAELVSHGVTFKVIAMLAFALPTLGILMTAAPYVFGGREDLGDE